MHIFFLLIYRRTRTSEWCSNCKLPTEIDKVLVCFYKNRLDCWLFQQICIDRIVCTSSILVLLIIGCFVKLDLRESVIHVPEKSYFRIQCVLSCYFRIFEICIQNFEVFSLNGIEHSALPTGTIQKFLKHRQKWWCAD